MRPIQSTGYAVHFDTDLSALKKLVTGDWSRVFFITDLNTSEKCLPFVLDALKDVLEGYDIIEVDPGEENKNIDYCIGIWRMLLDFGADRNALIINVGGGVVTDMGGFAASTFKRGLAFVHVPTTLLAQVDASVGGKTGIDLAGVKNIVGTFTQPRAVFISTQFLTTLPETQRISGFAEIVKHGLIRDAELFAELPAADPLNVRPELIHRSVEIKNAVVTGDPFEKGLRKTLNFGHTIGHAVESYSLVEKRKPLLHGEAIAIGMICEAWLSTQHNGLSTGELESIVHYLTSVFPAYTLPADSDGELLEWMKNDKKNHSGKIGFALLTRIGNCTWDHYHTEAEILAALGFYRSL